MRHKQVRVIVRPWVPRQIPYQVPKRNLEALLKETYPQLEKIVYVGWSKRKENGKRVLYFLLATGQTPSQARERFKTNTDYGNKTWIIR
ncbi:MAG TPA: hypothetical protein VG935_04330 [Patescibacteria group bacterium]|nr:hypothetical protein [Patescibacteria group bacterium]